MNKVEFNNEMIEIARIGRGFGQSQLATALGVMQGTVSKWEKGEVTVKDEIYQKIADVLDYPLDFFRQKINILPQYMVYYRKRKSVKQADVDKIRYSMFIYKHAIKQLLRLINLPNEVPYMSIEEYGTPETIAAYVRQRWKLPVGPIKNVTRVLERAGILVLLVDGDTNDFDGQILPDEEGLPVICINRNLSGDRQRFILVHELGHLIMHTKYFPRVDEDYEDEANRFASEFLMPKSDILKDFYSNNINLQYLSSLKSYWGVSMAALARRAYDLRMIDQAKYKSLYVQLGQAGYRKNEPDLGVIPEKPTIIKQIFDLYTEKLNYSEGTLAKHLFMNPKEFKYFKNLYFGGSSLKVVK